VIALDGYGNRELSVQGKNGFLVAADASAADFADKIAYMIDHPELAEEMGRFAKTFAQKFNIDTYTDKLLDIYSR
jgi:glycosyltransferase involved in cell wall biosynthesis